jgi:hypothetical protein
MRVSLFVLCLSLFTLAARGEVGDTRIGVSGPVMVLEGSAFWGANFTALHQISPNVEVGGETGFHIWSKSSGGASASVWSIPIMPTVLYSFDTNTPTFTPFVGLGLGVAVLHANVNLGGLEGSGTAVKFEGLAHLGAKFGAAKNFFADIKLGLLDSSFVFIPSIGWFF